MSPISSNNSPRSSPNTAWKKILFSPKMPFRRVQYPLHFDHINNLWFIEQAQHEIDTYGTDESGNLKLCSFRNMKEKGIQKFERNVSLSC
ncbi:hypothetical protein GIB67_019367 [Kingdonia uniflora]|uniref:Uncharacterized protein n=1 Tax=Kingdonia uniflora TaxID=39325 RepID=A0A7J7M1J8_9MAGN|nr:hypothetical protein GIB67_019367 [Kingdonia uniflora]